MTTEEQLRDRLRKIQALFEGATTAGERDAAAAAIDRLKKALGTTARTEPLVEFQFTMPDAWHRRLFSALCRRYGLKPFRYKRQRMTTVMVSAPRSFVDRTLWPEYRELAKDVLSTVRSRKIIVDARRLFRPDELAPAIYATIGWTKRNDR